jgi:uncharacterized membrane protein (UPF0136 family)
VDRKTLLWTVTVFIGCMVLFQAIDSIASTSGRGVSIAIKAAAALVIVAVIVIVQRRKPK